MIKKINKKAGKIGVCYHKSHTFTHLEIQNYWHLLLKQNKLYTIIVIFDFFFNKERKKTTTTFSFKLP